MASAGRPVRKRLRGARLSRDWWRRLRSRGRRSYSVFLITRRRRVPAPPEATGDGPHYVALVQIDLLLYEEGQIAEEGLVTLAGYLAGPFAKFGQAEKALDRCTGVASRSERIAIYSQGTSTLCFREPLP
jgi:hypothetical protein